MDAADIRRRRRFQARLAKAKWVVWALVVGLLLFYMHWRGQLTESARVVSDEFLTRVGRGELEQIQKRLLSKNLSEELPERRFHRQMALLARKLGHLQEFDLAEKELSWDNRVVRLVYRTTFTRATARAIFEIVVDDNGYWKLDTFFFWADNWKEL